MCAIGLHIPLLIFFNDAFFSLGKVFVKKNKHILSIEPNVIYCFNSIRLPVTFSNIFPLKKC